VDDFKARKSRYLLGQAQPMKSLGCIASAFKITRFPPPSNPNWKKKEKSTHNPHNNNKNKALQRTSQQKLKFHQNLKI
jgi:hypothetical protein